MHTLKMLYFIKFRSNMEKYQKMFNICPFLGCNNTSALECMEREAAEINENISAFVVFGKTIVFGKLLANVYQFTYLYK